MEMVTPSRLEGNIEGNAVEVSWELNLIISRDSSFRIVAESALRRVYENIS